jgi:hypothetical protein
MTAYLQPGDQIHLVWASTGDAERDAREIADMRAAYTQLGVNIAIATTAGFFRGVQNPEPVHVPESRVIAVFRTPGPAQEATR